MNIKKGDKVKILNGKDRGKTGKVLQIFVERNKASVEGLNLSIKHMRPRRKGEKGQRIEFPAPIALSNLMVVCPHCGRPTRIGHKTTTVGKNVGGRVEKTEKKVRLCQKCQAVIE
jgi:large subunit ribosomal protein L24